MTNRLMDPCLVEVHKKSPREVVGQNVESYLFEEQGSHLKNVDLVTSKAMEDIQCMGLQDVVGEFSNSLELTKGKSSWEANVDKQNNIHLAFGELDELREIPDTLEESRGFFPELITKHRKEKKYSSLKEFQDKALSERERKKRDRALKRVKKSKQDVESSELSGRSLSDSDLTARWNAAIKEARKAIELGKSLGMQIEGDESEAVREIALLDWN
ncbi:hypothetical protein V6N11_016616 [Hibiscus sabdariffa]|uniref:Uncharacterized protein n=1 Tax=Hibiscus sabdariffa TaxID=183260 RepID=A0ABR2TVV1_9ROSI